MTSAHKYMVQHRDDMEKRRRNGTEPPGKGVDHRGKELTPTHSQRKYQGCCQMTRSSGNDCLAIQKTQMTDDQEANLLEKILLQRRIGKDPL